jgi:hypothetical protein
LKKIRGVSSIRLKAFFTGNAHAVPASGYCPAEVRMTKIVALGLSEPVRVDSRRRDEIIVELGRRAGEDVITAGIEQLAEWMAVADNAVSRNDAAQLLQLSQHLSRLAWQLGLISLATVAMDLGLCVERRDRTAVTAVHARLHRVGNLSLMRIWDSPETG